MESFKQTEHELQQQLKQICNKRGRETFSHKAAEIFNKLGLLYRINSQDKISLIQSAALLNAAIIRLPHNQKFHDDLCDLCRRVLNCANAEQNLTNLVQISKRVATQIKEMRENTQKQLGTIEKITEKLWDDERKSKEQSYINQVKSLLFNVSSDYKRIMAYISQKSIQIMGPPPCKYTLVGLGSLARNEITPYSDFEHVLLLHNFQQQASSNERLRIKEYFRWYSVLFHIIVINLQESILPNVAIPCLNDTLTPGGDWFWDIRTPQGISFDCLKPLASKVPLGRTQKTPNKPWTTELIKPVDEMVKYVEADEDLKNGYKLGDMLTRTCYVDGDETLYAEFCWKRKETLKRNLSNVSNIKATLHEDLANFDIDTFSEDFLRAKSIDIKRSIYRGITLFISALGRLHNVDENSNFDIIDEFVRRQAISQDSAHKLSHAVAVACHVRLFLYMSKKRQEDTIRKENETTKGEKKLEEICKAVNSGCLVKCSVATAMLQLTLSGKQYYPEKKQTTLENQCNNAIYKLDDNFNKWSLHANLFSFVFLGLVEEGILFGENYFAHKDVLLEHDILGCYYLNRLYASSSHADKYFALSRVLEKCAPRTDLLGRGNLMFDGLCLYLTGEYLQALSVFDAAIQELRENSDESKHEMISQCFRKKGFIKTMLHRYHEALSEFRDERKHLSLQLSTGIDDDTFALNKRYVPGHAKTMLCITLCLFRVGRIQQARHMAREGCNMLDVKANHYVLPPLVLDHFRKLLKVGHLKQDFKF